MITKEQEAALHELTRETHTLWSDEGRRLGVAGD
jgi:hypothetical protein